MDFLGQVDWMLVLRAFIVGGLICVIGQILIDKTKLTPARILVICNSWCNIRWTWCL